MGEKRSASVALSFFCIRPFSASATGFPPTKTAEIASDIFPPAPAIEQTPTLRI